MSHAIKGKNGLTAKQEAFVVAYLGAAAGNPTHAARLAGYAAKNKESLAECGRTCLSTPHVVEEIKRRRGEFVRVNTLARVEILERMTRILEDPDSPNSEKIRAADVICKMEGHYSEKRVVESRTEVTFADRRDDFRRVLEDREAREAMSVLVRRCPVSPPSSIDEEPPN